MRHLPTKKTVRGLFAAEGYLELELPQRALRELDRVENAGVLEPYGHYLRGQALQQLERFEEAIEALQEAARTMPAPLNGQVWEELSHCFRHEGLQELADIAELFAEDALGGADRDFSEPPCEEFLTGSDEELSLTDEFGDSWNPSGFFPLDDFDQYNFDEDWPEFNCDEDFNSSPYKRPKK